MKLIESVFHIQVISTLPLNWTIDVTEELPFLEKVTISQTAFLVEAVLTDWQSFHGRGNIVLQLFHLQLLRKCSDIKYQYASFV